MAEADSCSICIEPQTRQPQSKRAQCPQCNVQACVRCTERQLLSSHEDPHCMGCRKGWSREVLDNLFPKTWINETQKKHRENILLDRERSRLPDAQIVVERMREAETLRPALEVIVAQMTELDRKRMELSRQQNELNTTIHYLSIGQAPPSVDERNAKSESERRIFVLPCPAEGCRGFLSSAYKCGVCELWTCPDCREVKGADKEAEHTCNPDTVKTVAAMKKECRNCPDCGASIFRIHGCSQMFCTNCKTGFDWTTGKKVTSGIIHNPHYFDQMRTLSANGAVPRAPGDIPCDGRMPDPHVFARIATTEAMSTKKLILQSSLQQINHIRAVVIVNLRAQDQGNQDINVRYLQKGLSEEMWKRLLQQREKRRMRKQEMVQCLEAFVATCVDIQGSVNDVRDAKKDVIDAAMEKAYNQMTQLVNIYNEGAMKIAARYKHGAQIWVQKKKNEKRNTHQGWMGGYGNDLWACELKSYKELFPAKERPKKPVKDSGAEADDDTEDSGDEMVAVNTTTGGNLVVNPVPSGTGEAPAKKRKLKAKAAQT